MADLFDTVHAEAQAKPAGDLFDHVNAEAHKSSWLDDVGDTLKQYFNKINPATLAQGAAGIVEHPGDAYTAYQAQHEKILDKAAEAFHNGDYSEMVRHTLSYYLEGIPGVGALLDNAGTKAGNGDYKGAIADTGALATQIAAMKFGPAALDAATEPGAIPRAAAKVVPDVVKNALAAGGKDVVVGTVKAGTGAGAVMLSHHLGPAGELTGALTGQPLMKAGAKQVGQGLKAGYQAAKETFFPPIEPPAPVEVPLRDSSATAQQPGVVPVTAPAPVQPYAVPVSAPQPPVQGPMPQAAPVAQSPVFPTASTATIPASQYAAAPAPQPVPVAAPAPVVAPVETPAPVTPPVTAAAPGAPEGANAIVSPAEMEWIKKRSADTAAKDDVIATWLQKNGKTSADVQPGQPFADMVKQVNKDTGKRYVTKIDDPTHAARVQAVADLLDQKNAAAAIEQAAAAKRAALGQADPTVGAEERFNLMKKMNASTPPQQ